MSRMRIPETEGGFVDQATIASYDLMQRTFRDRGWIETELIIKNGITRGCALEIGPGPGYLGLEWLKRTEGTTLKAVEISPEMILVAKRNAAADGLSDRVEYVRSSGSRIPFCDETFDAVFTNGSLHEWNDPRGTFNEIGRVLKTGGRVFISDLRRDMAAPMRWFLWLAAKPKEMRPGLVSSIRSAYTVGELRELIRATRLSQCTVSSSPIGLLILGRK
jgi:ubiquinone/menaquinone biosynthesis C-methylase UbiE